MKKYKLKKSDFDLIKAGLAVLEKNFDDGVYNHTVGCALRCSDGSVFSGVNCDGVHGSCAEYITIGTAISSGHRDFDTIVAVHDKATNCVISPCGNCRQMMVSYCPDVFVIINDETQNLVKVKARDLLPFAWQKVVVEN